MEVGCAPAPILSLLPAFFKNTPLWEDLEPILGFRDKELVVCAASLDWFCGFRYEENGCSREEDAREKVVCVVP